MSGHVGSDHEGMSHRTDADDMLVQTRLRHLENELHLLREEYLEKARNYYQLYSRLEEKVEERTAELRELQRTLERKNRQLEIIFDSSPVIIFYLNARGEYERVNRRFAAMLGRSVTEVVGRTPAELLSQPGPVPWEEARAPSPAPSPWATCRPGSAPRTGSGSSSWTWCPIWTNRARRGG
jgi:PAS domain-containing protein